jgi:hypothetical protein
LILTAEVRAEIAQGTDPASERAQELGRRWMSLVSEFTGGDPGVTAALGSMVQKEPEVRQRTGLDAEIFGYIQKVQALAESQG